MATSRTLEDKLDHDDEYSQPSAKRRHLSDSVGEVNMNQSVKEILFNINKAICLRLDDIESHLEAVNSRTQFLQEKVDQVVLKLKQNGNLGGHSIIKKGALDTGTDYIQPGVFNGDTSLHNMGHNVQLITLNTEEDFPNGTWVGDENNPEMRVRVPISPSNLLHIHSNCRTPEKMALALLDYLFDRETQATSNLSGLGKHGKRQLDPLMIYGIRCHLIHQFSITEMDWHRIKQNIDSKCRTAFRRNIRGLPLHVKAFRGKSSPMYMHLSDDDYVPESKMQLQQQNVMSLNQMQEAGSTEILQMAGGEEIQVLHATPEQVAQLQQTHQIQILQGDGQVLQGYEGMQLAVSQEGIQFVTTSSGESIQINNAADDSLIENKDDDMVPVDVGALHSTTQNEDGLLQIETEDGTMQQIKITSD